VSTAWVLRGGASFGAAQVGMAHALIEAGHHPGTVSRISSAGWTSPAGQCSKSNVRTVRAAGFVQAGAGE
jgi:hypothetical protein